MKPPVKATPRCGECGSAMVLRHRKGDNKPFWGCTKWPDCRGTHGAHPDGTPMGKPGDAPTRLARRQCHAVFDPLWTQADTLYDLPKHPGARVRERAKVLRIAKKRAYEWLAEVMEMHPDDCHIGAFNVEQCHSAIAKCQGQTPAGVRAWAQAKWLKERKAS